MTNQPLSNRSKYNLGYCLRFWNHSLLNSPCQSVHGEWEDLWAEGFIEDSPNYEMKLLCQYVKITQIRVMSSPLNQIGPSPVFTIKRECNGSNTSQNTTLRANSSHYFIEKCKKFTQQKCAPLGKWCTFLSSSLKHSF